ncbi:neurogenic differentiation factor 1-like [Macrosteles quadrilineatus]|uniref:neurogenic differentiation factor 1-like n=1 Tax=Macrosteles quadrilineatus TaxID=74068 RepID=UPI0023E15C99|nr:neurogenic differentiation factor 1-like [Macrosteles quadrilineatus]
MDLLHDTNNNTTLEKSYSLRPRASTKREENDIEEENWKPRGRTRKKPKQKSLPLSKYRRKTANARERFRMREINEAFEALRRAVPHLHSNTENPCEKLTKISTLRLAMKYITALSNALQDSDLDSDGDSFLSEWSTPQDTGSSTPSSTNDHADLYDHFFSPSSVESSSSNSPYLSTLLSSPTCDYSPRASTSCLNRVFECAYKQEASVRVEAPQLTSSTLVPTFPIKSSLTNSAVSSLEEDLSHHFLTAADLQTSLLDELDGLPSPSVNIEDYLIT